MSEHNGEIPVRRAVGINLRKPIRGCYHVGIEIIGDGREEQITVWLLPPELEGARLVSCIGNSFTFMLPNGVRSQGFADVVCRPELDPELGKTVPFTDNPPA